MLQSIGLVLDKFGNMSDTWAWVFGAMGTINLLGAAFSWTFMDGEEQQWAKETDDEENEKIKLTGRQ